MARHVHQGEHARAGLRAHLLGGRRRDRRGRDHPRNPAVHRHLPGPDRTEARTQPAGTSAPPSPGASSGDPTRSGHVLLSIGIAGERLGGDQRSTQPRGTGADTIPWEQVRAARDRGQVRARSRMPMRSSRSNPHEA